MPEVVANGVRLNVVAMGQGATALVFVHGLLLDNHSSFYMSIAPAIAKHARVLLYDLRGHGRSEQPPSGYAIDDMVDDLRGLVDVEAGGQPVVVVGHSFGGHIALRFASRHPERTAALILLEAHSGVAEFGAQMAQTLALTGEARDAKLLELFGDWLTRHGARGHVDPANPAASGLSADGASTLKFAGRLAGRRKSALVTTAERLRDATTFVTDIASAQPLTDAQLASIRCPVLAFYGERSDIAEQGRELARLLPDCTLHLIEGAEHGVLFQSTAYLREAIAAWLAKRGP